MISKRRKEDGTAHNALSPEITLTNQMVWKGEAKDHALLWTLHMEALRTSGGGVRRSFVQVIKPTPSLCVEEHDVVMV